VTREPSPDVKNNGYGRTPRRIRVATPPANERHERSNRASEPVVFARTLRSRSSARNAGPGAAPRAVAGLAAGETPVGGMIAIVSPPFDQLSSAGDQVAQAVLRGTQPAHCGRQEEVWGHHKRRGIAGQSAHQLFGGVAAQWWVHGIREWLPPSFGRQPVPGAASFQKGHVIALGELSLSSTVRGRTCPSFIGLAAAQRSRLQCC
jgi:hypothetical protein